MTEDNKNEFLELIIKCLRQGYSEILNSQAKKLFLSYLKQDFKSIFPNIYDSMEAEMHNIDGHLLILLVMSIKALLFELQGLLDDERYQSLIEILDLWNVPRRFG